MPKEPSPFACSTPVPNALLDELLPQLSGAEWKVLCVVVRQTLGWSVGGDPRRRKEKDWITQAQFKQKAGLGSEAISRAIEGLVKKGVIQVLDERDRPLPTPAARRSCRGRLYFRLAVSGRDAPRGSGEEPAPAAAVRVPKSSLRHANSSFSLDSSESEVRKADTTKKEMYKREIRETLQRITHAPERRSRLGR